MNENNALVIPELNQEFQDNLSKLRAALSDDARKRRRRKTPKSHIKMKPVGGGKDAPTVERALYQQWLDDNFPGWSISELKTWETLATISLSEGTTQTTATLFHASFLLHVIEASGIKRTIPCVGSAPVALKELSRETSQLLSHKYVVALTNAFKTGCGWLGAFFDLRIDEEARELAALPPTEEQERKFKELIIQIPKDFQSTVREQWATQNSTSAIKYVEGLEVKVKQFVEQQKPK